jgi:gliding motility-associated-like protein
VKSSPNVTLSSPDLTICPNECAIISAVGTSSYAPFTYSWAGSSVTTSSISICIAGNVIVNFTDAKGCISTKTITVINDVIPVASFTASPPSPVIPGQVITFVNTSSVSSGSISPGSWTFGDGGSATGNIVNYAYASAGTYPITLYVTGSTGCSDTITMNYIVDALILAPNVFTPNGDNVNETLKFKNLEFFSTNNLTILNRWGTKIFEKDSYKNDWNGSGVVDGTYFYILSVPGATPNIYKGFFQMIR